MPTNRKRDWLRHTICAALLPAFLAGPTGCTVLVWTPACATQAVQPAISGLVRNYPDAGARALLITYRAHGDGTDVNLVVPIDRTGNPSSPFRVSPGGAFVVRYPDAAPAGAPVAGKLSDEQLADLMARGGTPRLDRTSLKVHLTTADWQPVAGASADYRPVLAASDERLSTARLLAYRFDDAGQVMAVNVKLPEGDPSPVVLPAGVHLLVVPASVERPPGDQTRNRVVAVALTPVTVAGDAALCGVAIGVTGAVLGVMIVCLPFELAYEAGKASEAKPNGNAPPADATPAKPAGPVTIPVIVTGGSTEGVAVNR